MDDLRIRKLKYNVPSWRDIWGSTRNGEINESSTNNTESPQGTVNTICYDCCIGVLGRPSARTVRIFGYVKTRCRPSIAARTSLYLVPSGIGKVLLYLCSFRSLTSRPSSTTSVTVDVSQVTMSLFLWKVMWISFFVKPGRSKVAVIIRPSTDSRKVQWDFFLLTVCLGERVNSGRSAPSKDLTFVGCLAILSSFWFRKLSHNWSSDSYSVGVTGPSELPEEPCGVEKGSGAIGLSGKDIGDIG